MRQISDDDIPKCKISEYDIYIFDCDGVILNANQLKIDAMKKTLNSLFTQTVSIEHCMYYFIHNFGKSRFHHTDVFLSKYLKIPEQDSSYYRQSILNSYASMCKKLYVDAEITPGFLSFIKNLKGSKFIASGSEQEELRYVFKKRKLDYLFDGIYGSPTAKSENIKNILHSSPKNNAIMFGDAVSDLQASIANNIDFIAYLPFSNVKDELKKLSTAHGFSAYNSWADIA